MKQILECSVVLNVVFIFFFILKWLMLGFCFAILYYHQNIASPKRGSIWEVSDFFFLAFQSFDFECTPLN